jgi:hypothetical protein
MASVRWFIAYRFLGACLPYLPVASLCLAARGLSWSAVLQLGALYAIASAALILPINALATRVGPRRTLIGGALAVAIGAIVAACGRDIGTMAVAQIFFAIAAAVDAGADSAYLWGLLAGDRDAYRRAEARSTAGKLAGGVVGIALGGALVAWSPAAPFAAAAVFALAAAACAARLEDVALPRDDRRSVAVAACDGAAGASGRMPDRRGPLSAAVSALLVAVGGHRWLLIGIVSCAVARVMASAIGPVLADVGLTPASATAVATAAALIAAGAAALTGLLRGSWRRLALFAGAPAVLAGCAIGLASAHGLTAALIVAVLPVIAAVIGPLWRSHLNQQAPASAPRMLMLAVDATVVRVVAALLQLIVTGAAPRAGVAALGVALIVVLAAVAAVIVLRDRRIRFALVAIAALALPQIAGAGPATDAPPAWAASAPALCTDELVIDKPLGQGSTIKFKAHVGTTKVVVRPEQTSAAGNFRADIAAHRLATALGLSTVPYGCVRRIDRAALDAVAGDALRTRLAGEVAWTDDGTAAVSVVAWVDGVKSAELETTRVAWRAQLDLATELTTEPVLAAAAAEGSKLAVWDFLIANWDRWSGGNTFRLGRTGAFVWLDNAAGFGREAARTRAARARTMRTTQRFSRAQIASLRALDDATATAVLADAGLAPARIADLLARRDLILAHVDGMVAVFGAGAVLAFD